MYCKHHVKHRKDIAAGKMFHELWEPHHVAIRRLAIRAAEFGPKADFSLGQWVKNPRPGNFLRSKKRGAIEGPIRIPLDSSLFLFNVLALPSISSKSLKFRSELFSTPTRFRHICITGGELQKNEAAKGGIKGETPGLVHSFQRHE